MYDRSYLHEQLRLSLGNIRFGRQMIEFPSIRPTRSLRSDIAVSFCSQPANRANIQEFVEEHRDPSATLYTDESMVHDGLANHETVRHSVGEYVQEQAHTNGIESFWALIKRGYYGTYHKMSEKHLPDISASSLADTTPAPSIPFSRWR